MEKGFTSNTVFHLRVDTLPTQGSILFSRLVISRKKVVFD